MFKRLLLAAIVVSSQVVLAAPTPEPACFIPKKKFDRRMLGNWQIEAWQVRYTIVGKANKICLYARDAAANEWFEISDLKWNGKVLEASFYLPSTQWRTHSKLSAESADKIRDEYSHKNGKETDFWTRRK